MQQLLTTLITTVLFLILQDDKRALLRFHLPEFLAWNTPQLNMKSVLSCDGASISNKWKTNLTLHTLKAYQKFCLSISFNRKILIYLLWQN